ncbi:MAG: hypothetical protein ACN4E2_04415 [Nitrospinota bacterium]
MEKNITILLDQAPSLKLAEKMRMGLGLTLVDENRVNILVIADGIRTFLIKPGEDRSYDPFDLSKHLLMLSQVEVPFFIEQEAAINANIKSDSKSNLTLLDSNQISIFLSKQSAIL